MDHFLITESDWKIVSSTPQIKGAFFLDMWISMGQYLFRSWYFFNYYLIQTTHRKPIFGWHNCPAESVIWLTKNRFSTTFTLVDKTHIKLVCYCEAECRWKPEGTTRGAAPIHFMKELVQALQPNDHHIMRVDCSVLGSKTSHQKALKPSFSWLGLRGCLGAKPR